MHSSILFFAGLFAAAFIGSFVQTLVGFGAAVFILLYLSNFISLSAAPSVSAVVCLALNISIFLRFRKFLQLKVILWSTVIYSAVSLVTVSLIKNFKVTLLSVLFGIFLILIAVYYLFLSEKLKINEKGPGMMIFSSGISGLFAGLFSIGGPTLSVYYLALCGAGGFYIASLQLSFIAANVVITAGRVFNGLLTSEMIPMIVTGLAAAFAGQLTGEKVRSYLSLNILSRLVYISVGLSGVLVLVQQL